MKFICDEFSLLTARMRMFRLKPASSIDVIDETATPGEYFSFTFRNEENISFQRHYTLVSVNQGKHYEFIIEDKGEGSASAVISRLLTDKKEVAITARGGEITFDTIRDKNDVLLVAGGVGITLPLALIRECFKYYGYRVTGKSVLLILSCHDLQSVPCLNELLDLHTRCNWFSLCIHITRGNLEKMSDIIRPGRADLTTASIDVPPETTIICGSTGFAEAMVTAIRKRFPQTTIAAEAFSSAPTALITNKVESQTEKRRLTIKNLNREFAADVERTILDNLIQQDVPIRNMCRAGICGSCKFKLDSGSVRSEPDFCLSAKDQAENIYLACCSFPDKDAVINII